MSDEETRPDINCPSLTVGGITAIIFSLVLLLLTLALAPLILRILRKKSRLSPPLREYSVFDYAGGREKVPVDKNKNRLSIDSVQFRETLRDDGRSTQVSLEVSPPLLKFCSTPCILDASPSHDSGDFEVKSEIGADGTQAQGLIYHDSEDLIKQTTVEKSIFKPPVMKVFNHKLCHTFGGISRISSHKESSNSCGSDSVFFRENASVKQSTSYSNNEAFSNSEELSKEVVPCEAGYIRESPGIRDVLPSHDVETFGVLSSHPDVNIQTYDENSHPVRTSRYSHVLPFIKIHSTNSRGSRDPIPTSVTVTGNVVVNEDKSHSVREESKSGLLCLSDTPKMNGLTSSPTQTSQDDRVSKRKGFSHFLSFLMPG